MTSADLESKPPRASALFLGSWKLGFGVATLMVLLALVGVALATIDVATARTYWITLVPIYGLLCTFTAWRRSQATAGASAAQVVRQVVHWLAIGAAVALDFYVRGTGIETQVASGLSALLLLALGCFLAGVHLDWPFAGVGLLLALTLVCVAKADQYLWVLFLAALVVVAAILGARWMLGAKPPQPS